MFYRNTHKLNSQRLPTLGKVNLKNRLLLAVPAYLFILINLGETSHTVVHFKIKGLIEFYINFWCLSFILLLILVIRKTITTT